MKLHPHPIGILCSLLIIFGGKSFKTKIFEYKTHLKCRNEGIQHSKYDLNLREENISFIDEMKSSFLSYSLSTLLGRALPDVRDGLKPVHRRILYGMLGNSYSQYN